MCAGCLFDLLGHQFIVCLLKVIRLEARHWSMASVSTFHSSGCPYCKSLSTDSVHVTPFIHHLRPVSCWRHPGGKELAKNKYKDVGLIFTPPREHTESSLIHLNMAETQESLSGIRWRIEALFSQSEDGYYTLTLGLDVLMVADYDYINADNITSADTLFICW